MTNQNNPYLSPTETNPSYSANEQMEGDPIPEKVAKEINNLVRDARMAVLVGLIPILGLPFIWRLVQWYLLKNRYPILVSRNAGVHEKLARDFRGSIFRLWFAVLCWPIVFIVCFLYLRFS